MFRISENQWRAFEASQVRRFVTLQANRLESSYPESVTSQFNDDRARFEQAIELWIDEAATFGVHGEDDVAYYLDCLFEIGFDFAKNDQWSSEILRRRDIDGTAKMDLIWQRLHPQARVEQTE
ncbi:MAG: hypothetical protein KF752_08150 [Pirellulaceae bacterium]|nr:hypothetical protein [Pirellulaceae bacterium]